MELLTRIILLTEEVRDIVQENKRYFTEGNKRDAWQKLQHEKRRIRLEEIKDELGYLKHRMHH